MITWWTVQYRAIAGLRSAAVTHKYVFRASASATSMNYAVCHVREGASIPSTSAVPDRCMKEMGTSSAPSAFVPNEGVCYSAPSASTGSACEAARAGSQLAHTPTTHMNPETASSVTGSAGVTP